ncbi:Soluble lytic murein transglycosylase precursor [Marinobacterium sp. xm-d-509]|nr:Soluble lytic murein transglycosylase precursor [Marinobacterium sp. xm-d-509]
MRALLTTNKLNKYLAPILFSTFAISIESMAKGKESAEQLAFLKAERLAKLGRLDLDDPAAKQLESYPLYPYLVFNQYSAELNRLTPEDIQQFANRYPDSHLEGLLRFNYTEHLGEKRDWGAFLSHYTEIDSPNTEMQCRYAEALYRQKRTTEASKLAASLWSVGRSQPDSCDDLFRLFRANGDLTSDVALKRVLNALDANKWGLSGYALRFVKSESDRRIADAARSVYRSPFKVLRMGSGYSAKQLAKIQRIAIERAYRHDPYEALNLLLKLGKGFDLSLADNLQELTRVGVRVAKELDAHDRIKLAKLDPTFASAELTEWRIRLALLEQDWQEVATLIAKLPKELQDSPRWQYWLAALPNNPMRTEILDTLRTKRSFYGFLAADHLGQPADLNHEPITLDPTLLAKLRDSKHYLRIKELTALDRYTVSRSEFNRWIETMSSNEIQHAAHLMNELGWYQQGILAAAYHEFWNDMDLRFPEGFENLFIKHANKRNIDPIWAQALARQESALFPWARSSVGARGLMQLMPRTAKRTAKSIKVKYKSSNLLYDPDFNVQLGTAYLAQMYRQFDKNRIYATAAYNAGPHRVSRWLKGRENLPLEIFIELIPFDETRTYVQNVLSFSVIYAQRKGQTRQMLTPTEQALLALN